MISHDGSLEMENTWAMEFDEAPTLESKVKDSLDKHGSFTPEIPQEPCSFNASPESGMLSTSHTHTREKQSLQGVFLQNLQEGGCRRICLS